MSLPHFVQIQGWDQFEFVFPVQMELRKDHPGRDRVVAASGSKQARLRLQQLLFMCMKFHLSQLREKPWKFPTMRPIGNGEGRRWSFITIFTAF